MDRNCLGTSGRPWGNGGRAHIAKARTWPDSPRSLAGRLRRAATFLRKIGIEIGFDREGHARTRIIRLTATSGVKEPKPVGARPSAPSAPSAPMAKSNSANDFSSPDLRTVANHADGVGDRLTPTVRADPLKSNGMTIADGADANHPPQSEPEKIGWSARL